MSLWNIGASIARSILSEEQIKRLRGDRKSVHARFVLDPKERLNLFLHRLRGGTYLSWYAARQDRHALRRRTEDPSVHDSYYESGIEDLEIIKKLGVKPHHMVHEFGCGSLRTARFFIDYLDEGNYSANDTSGERIEFGKDRWRREGRTLVEDKKPLLIASTDNTFNWMDGRKVDFIWCHAVFGHMPPEDIDETIGNMKTILKPGGAIIFTYGENPYTEDKVIRTSVKDWYHSLDYFKNLAAKYGMSIEECSEDINKTYPNDDVLVMRPL